MREKLSPEKSGWGWKLLIVAIILGVIFMLFFYLAVTNDPEYMPSHQQKHTQQHAFKTAPAMTSPAGQQNMEMHSSDHDSVPMNMSDMNMDQQHGESSSP